VRPEDRRQRPSARQAQGARAPPGAARARLAARPAGRLTPSPPPTARRRSTPVPARPRAAT
jgi:hypothetical protein